MLAWMEPNAARLRCLTVVGTPGKLDRPVAALGVSSLNHRHLRFLKRRPSAHLQQPVARFRPARHPQQERRTAGQPSAALPVSQKRRAGVALEQIGAADIAGHGAHVPMPGHLHDAGEFDVALGGARHKPGPKTMAGEVVGLQPLVLSLRHE